MQKLYRECALESLFFHVNNLCGQRINNNANKSYVGPVWDAKFSGDRVITCGEDSTIRIWDSWTKHCLKILSGHLAGVLSVSLRQTSGTLPLNLFPKVTK